MSIYQILLATIALIFLLGAVSKFLKKESGQTFFKVLLSTIVWGAIFVFSLLPQSVHTISERLGLGSNLNTLIFIGFVLIFIILFKLLGIIERIERNISELVRKEALLRYVESKHNKRD